jgi:hypothetical protein
MSSDDLPLIRYELFDKRDDAYRAALDELREVMLRSGFVVHRRPAKETTLRCYVAKGLTYPLLNPRFELSVLEEPAVDPDSTTVLPVLVITVLSKGDPTLLEEFLPTFPTEDGCDYGASGRGTEIIGGYHIHGWFRLPVTFPERGGLDVIDVDAMAGQLRRIRSFLEVLVTA